ncbi:MAG: translocation/assembly module TamB, partial [Muribaculaceae bacterium]|nr:translocation/assembly module TamB [Muribaculaceae bacterium]
VRYTPPLMSEKLFNFDDGSYIAFNGDMMNPTLNIHATDVLKANVTQEGQNSRLVNFDVILNVTGTFNNMNVGFDLTTRDDITVANELESMSAEQRANQAMNLLLYNVYTGPGTKGNASLSGNPLFSFLESQLNSWAANTIKGVDISFGIDQYDRTVDGASSQTTSYSYQVSKSLFNDRFKIVVGGNYSTDANADENFSQNLINDISFLYYLNNKRSMYVRIFRHTGYESIIEGEVTETGVGFVYRRKLDRVGDMFKFLRRKKRRQQTPAGSSIPANAEATENKDVKPEADSTEK